MWHPRISFKPFLLRGRVPVLVLFALWGVVQWICLVSASTDIPRWLLITSAAAACLLVMALAALALRRQHRDQEDLEIRFQSLLEATPDALVITNLKGLIIRVNCRAEELFDCKREELLGKSIKNVFVKATKSDVLSSVTDVFSTSQADQERAAPDVICRRKDGSEITLEVNCHPLRTENGVLIVHSIRDITEHKARERRRAARQAARRILAEVDNFSDAVPYLLQALGKSLGWEIVSLWTVDSLTYELRCLRTWRSAKTPADILK